MSKDETKEIKVVRKRNDNMIVYYANDVQVSHTPNETQISFGQSFHPPFNPPVEIPNEVVVNQGVMIVMTLAEAELFLQALSANLKKARAKQVAMLQQFVEEQPKTTKPAPSR